MGGGTTTIGDFEVTETMMLKRGEQVPHVEVRTVQGGVFSYSAIWQRKNLLLVLLPKSTLTPATYPIYVIKEGRCIVAVFEGAA